MPTHVWNTIVQQVQLLSQQEPLMKHFLQQAVLQHNNLSQSLAWLIAHKLSNNILPFISVHECALKVFETPEVLDQISTDLQAVYARDSACRHMAFGLLFYKGFHALQAYRVAHSLWQAGNESFAQLFQSRSSAVFNVDIHPAAVLGKGIMLDHASGIVIGETARVGDNVSIMQSVTLGGTGKEHNDRHPKISNGVLISCGAKILGNINIGKNVKVAAGSVVLKDVPAHTIVAGVPAKVIAQLEEITPALNMNHHIDCNQVNQALKRR